MPRDRDAAPGIASALSGMRRQAHARKGSRRLAGLPETHHPLRGRRHQAGEIHPRALDVRRCRHPVWPHPQQDQRAHGGPFQPDHLADDQDRVVAVAGNQPVESGRNFVPAQRTILALHHAGELNQSALLGFAKAYKYEESIAALSAMSAVKIATLDRLIMGDRHEPILIVGKAVGLEWATVRALILLRLGPNRVPSPADIESARVNFGRLMPSTAERVVSFWQTRQSA